VWHVCICWQSSLAELEILNNDKVEQESDDESAESDDERNYNPVLTGEAARDDLYTLDQRSLSGLSERLLLLEILKEEKIMQRMTSQLTDTHETLHKSSSPNISHSCWTTTIISPTLCGEPVTKETYRSVVLANSLICLG